MTWDVFTLFLPTADDVGCFLLCFCQQQMTWDVFYFVFANSR